MKLLNVGCGTKFICSEQWVNIDIGARHQCVIEHNIIKGLPFDNNSFDVVYHSNILEHLQKKEAENFTKECFRVLKKGGILRIAVPDLEAVVKQYLVQLERARNQEKNAEFDYEWIVIELLDQITRIRSGGLMGKYLNREHIFNKEYIYQRIGEDGKLLIEHFEEVREQKKLRKENKKVSSTTKTTFFTKFKNILKKGFWKDKLLRRLLKDEYWNLPLAKFRSKGEVHQWMYDSYSLKKLLEKTGFAKIEKTTAFQSNISQWNKYSLDVKDNKILKPDSFFTEATK